MVRIISNEVEIIFVIKFLINGVKTPIIMVYVQI